jgi:hypothetical protein
MFEKRRDEALISPIKKRVNFDNRSFMFKSPGRDVLNEKL